MSIVYDVAIIGGGPAGLTAALYSARSKLKTIIIEKAKWGGQTATTEEVENYPGAIENSTGPKLMERMKQQAVNFGAELLEDEVIQISVVDNKKILHLGETELEAKVIIICTGSQPMLLGVQGENELRGKGVSYCATCDADFFTELEVVAIGGGDSAVEEAIYLSKFADKVTIIHRRDKFKAAKSIVEKALKNEKIHVIWDTIVEEIYGNGIVEGVKLENVKNNEISYYDTNGVFVFVGAKPNTSFLKKIVHMDEKGYIKTDEKMKTSVKGVFAAGDVRSKVLRQVVTATSDGAIAAMMAEKFIEDNL